MQSPNSASSPAAQKVFNQPPFSHGGDLLHANVRGAPQASDNALAGIIDRFKRTACVGHKESLVRFPDRLDPKVVVHAAISEQYVFLHGAALFFWSLARLHPLLAP